MTRLKNEFTSQIGNREDKIFNVKCLFALKSRIGMNIGYYKQSSLG
jgi:hypothetical protein